MSIRTTYLTIAALAIISVFSAHAQKGSFLVNNHIRETGHTEGISFQISSDSRGLLSMANTLGVYQYDGKVWDFYPTPSAALSIATDDDNQIYVGCINGFGTINWRDYNIHYISLHESDSTSQLFYQTEHFQSKVYFLSEKMLYVYDPESKKVIGKIEDNFLNLYKLGDKLYVNTEEKVFQIDEAVLKEVNGANIDNKIARVITNAKNKSVALGFDGYLYEINDGEFDTLKSNTLLDDYGISAIDINFVNEEIIICSTLDYGCVFINLNDPEYLEILDNSMGLPDNEIYATHVDKEGGVWVSHEYGLSRVLPSFPAKSYSHLPGLQGNLLAVNRYHNKLWLSTSSGVFFIDKDTTFANKVYYVAQKVNTAKKKKPVEQRVVQPVQEESKEDDKKAIRLGKLFKNKKKNQEDEDKSSEKKQEDDKKDKKPGFLKKIFSKVDDIVSGDAITLIKGKPKSNVRYVRRVKQIPVDIRYKYTKVPGSSGKCKDLIVFDDHLLAASTSGLIEIEDSAHIVIDEPISAVQILNNEEHRILVSTYDHEVKLFEVHDEVWIEVATLDPDDVILDIYQDDAGEIWMAGSSKIMDVHLEGDELQVRKEYPIDNHRFDDILMSHVKDTTFFINTQGYFYMDNKSDQLVAYDRWKDKLGLPVSYFKDALGFIWIYNGKDWYEISKFGDIKKHKYFSIFPKLRRITYDKETDKYWLITSDNDLLAYDHKAEHIDSLAHPLFLKTIRASDGILKKRDKLNIKYDNTFLSFEMSKPDYLGLLDTEFKYKLAGMNDNWSNWSSNQKIDFSYLPPGDYELFVQSRDSFGNVENAESIKFKVATPYWQQPWFYLMQIVIFGGLVVFTSRLSQEKKSNRIIKAGLSVLTLIVIIEFCQSAMGSLIDLKSTPVIDFLIDVSTALLVFPLEMLLRHIMLERDPNKKKKVVEEASTEPVTSEA